MYITTCEDKRILIITIIKMISSRKEKCKCVVLFHMYIPTCEDKHTIIKMISSLKQKCKCVCYFHNCVLNCLIVCGGLGSELCLGWPELTAVNIPAVRKAGRLAGVSRLCCL